MGKTILKSGQVLRLTYEYDDGTALISGVYQEPRYQGGASITGDGSPAFPLTVVLTPKQTQADAMYGILSRLKMGFTTLFEASQEIDNVILTINVAEFTAPAAAPPPKANAPALLSCGHQSSQVWDEVDGWVCKLCGRPA